MKKTFSLGLVALLAVAVPLGLRHIVFAQTQPQATTANLPEPTIKINLPDELVTIKLTNQTNDAVKYQIVTDTEVQSLLGQSEVTLKSLRVPISLVFHYASIPRSFVNKTGLIEAELIQDPETQDLEVIFKPTTDPALDSSSIEIDVQGDVYVF